MSGPPWWSHFRHWWVIIWVMVIWAYAVVFPWWISVFTAAGGLCLILWLLTADD